MLRRSAAPFFLSEVFPDPVSSTYFRALRRSNSDKSIDAFHWFAVMGAAAARAHFFTYEILFDPSKINIDVLN